MIFIDENFKAWLGSLTISVLTIISINLISSSVESHIPYDKSDRQTVIEIWLPPEEVKKPQKIQEKRITKIVKERVNRAPQEIQKLSENVEKDIKEPPQPEQSITEKVLPEKKEVRVEGQPGKETAITSSRTDTQLVAKDIPPQPSKAIPASKPPESQSAQRDPLVSYFQKLRDLIKQHKRYPDDARRRGQEGIVLVRVRITETGKIERVEIVKSSGFPALDRETLRVLKSLGTLPPPPVPKPLEFNLEVEYKLGA